MTYRPRIKICGIREGLHGVVAADAGADAIGLVFYRESPRFVTPGTAANVVALLPPFVTTVGLFVDADEGKIHDTLATVRLDCLQFHGSETPEWLALIKNNTALEVWKAWGVRNADSLAKATKYAGAVHRMLYDAPANKAPGGQGLAIDWSLLANHRHELPWGLAGGLTPANVAEAIAQTRAPLVDASSGLESAPGVKDANLIRAFCEAARKA